MQTVHIFQNDEQLVEAIQGYKGCSMATMETITEPKMNKKSRVDGTPTAEFFNGTVVCEGRRFVSIGNTYETAVNNRRDKEGGEKDFEAMELPWGEWYNGSRIILQHKGSFYLRASYLNANSPKTEKVYKVNGKVLTEDQAARLHEFLPPKKGSSRQGVENEVIVNSTKIANVIRLKFDGKVYVRDGYLNAEEKAVRAVWLTTTPTAEATEQVA